jgi:diguanylate cyclase (GGDEF)-like protein
MTGLRGQRERYHQVGGDQPERLASRAVGDDELTGLANRRLFTTIAPALLGEGRPAVVVVLDIGGLGPVNNTFGYQFGDEILRVAGGRLAGCVRDDLVARLGGAQFAAVLTSGAGSAGEQWWRPTVAGLRAAVAEPVRFAGRVFQLTPTAGVAPATDGLHIGELLRRADSAMLRAKAAGLPCLAWCPELAGGRVTERTIEFTLTPGARPPGVAA